jgi:DNA-binding CsgD family transcriptional regulator/tetratricopeptide (TPR) repeat protein
VGLLERDDVLERLDGLIAEASWRRGRLVLLRGEAGSGKTSVVEAFTSGRESRVLWGMCDPVVPPRPLAPVFDIAEQVGGVLQAALSDPDRHRIVSAFLAVLRADPGPWIAVLEDVQWADEATLEVLRVVGRRTAQLRALIIATFRDEEVGPDHPLAVALGDIPAASTVSISLPPLSLAAVQQLAAGTTVDPQTLHRVSAGNPFFVTEVLAAGGASLPSTVREAVWARAKRLPPAALQVVRAASVLGSRCDPRALCAVAGVAPAAVDECAAAGVLQRQPSGVEFRHELARRAVLESLPASERAELHRRALAALRDLSPSTEVGELARHASEAGDVASMLELGPKAGAAASALGSHKTALAHYDRVLPHVGALALPERAAVLAAHAYECSLTDNYDLAVGSQQEAIACLHQYGDTRGEGGAMSDLAGYLWWNGDTARAHRTADEAVDLLQTIEADATVARAYSRLAQVLMMSGRYAVARPWAEKAFALAEAFDAEPVVVHALNTLGVTEYCLGSQEGWTKLEESLRRARAADLEGDVVRALGNLIASARENRLYDHLDKYYQQATAFFEDHDLDSNERCLTGDIVDSLVDRVLWEAASHLAHQVVDRSTISGRPQSLASLGRIAARRGDPTEAWRWLDEALTLQERFGGEVAYPLRPARAEAAWLAGDVREAAAEIRAGMPAIHSSTNPWLLGEFAFWAHNIGVEFDCPARPAEPYAFYLDGHPEKAAAAWAERGCPYEQAQALVASSEETDIRRALSIFQALDAVPAARLATERLRQMGATRIARGPQATTRANPSGLSERELEVLVLLAGGLRNSEIAKRLVVSTRTVDHHVSAILTKLKVRSRFEAGQKAIAMGLTNRPSCPDS